MVGLTTPVQWKVYQETVHSPIKGMSQNWVNLQRHAIRGDPNYLVLLDAPDVFMFRWIGPIEMRAYGDRLITYVRII